MENPLNSPKFYFPITRIESFRQSFTPPTFCAIRYYALSACYNMLNFIYGTMHRKTNEVFVICVRKFATRVTSLVLVMLLVSELVWYLANEVCKVRKLRRSINYIHKAYRTIRQVIKKYQLKMNQTG